MRWLVYGGYGWIGTQLCELLEGDVIKSNTRVDNEQEVDTDISTLRADRVICLIGRTHGDGCNTIDYLEDKSMVNLRDNLYSPLILVLVCKKYQIHLTYFGTGCIFSNIEECFSDNRDGGYTEESKPDFFWFIILNCQRFH